MKDGEQGEATVQLDAEQVAEIVSRLAETSPKYMRHRDVRAYFRKPAG